MLGIDTGTLVLAGLYAAWRLLRWRRPSWAAKLRALKPIARQAFDQVELLAPLIGIAGNTKWLAFIELMKPIVADSKNWARYERELALWTAKWAENKTWLSRRLKDVRIPSATLPRSER